MHRLHHQQFSIKVLLATVVTAVAASAPAELPQLSPPSPRLAWPLTLRWQGVTLRSAAERLNESQGLFIWLDRRLDPATEVNLAASQMPVARVLDELTERLGADWVAVGDFIYLGPPAAAGELRTLLALSERETSQLASGVQRKLRQTSSLDIARLTQPRQLVEQLAQQAGLRVEHADRVPHDVWPAAKLPPMSTADQLAILLFGFELRWRASDGGRGLRIESIETPLAWRHLYERSQLEQTGVEIEAAAMEPGPEASRVWVSGPLELHERLLDRRVRSPRRAPPAPASSRQVYSLEVAEQPVGEIIAQLAAQLGKRLEIDPRLAGKPALAQRVSFEVKQAELGELLEAACAPVGIAARVAGDTIHLEPVAGE